MPETMTNLEIEDVLSSIRRLVTLGERAQARRDAAPAEDKLLLGPGFRVGTDATAADGNFADAPDVVSRGEVVAFSTTTSPVQDSAVDDMLVFDVSATPESVTDDVVARDPEESPDAVLDAADSAVVAEPAQQVPDIAVNDTELELSDLEATIARLEATVAARRNLLQAEAEARAAQATEPAIGTAELPDETAVPLDMQTTLSVVDVAADPDQNAMVPDLATAFPAAGVAELQDVSAPVEDAPAAQSTVHDISDAMARDQAEEPRDPFVTPGAEDAAVVADEAADLPMSGAVDDATPELASAPGFIPDTLESAQQEPETLDLTETSLLHEPATDHIADAHDVPDTAAEPDLMMSQDAPVLAAETAGNRAVDTAEAFAQDLSDESQTPVFDGGTEVHEKVETLLAAPVLDEYAKVYDRPEPLQAAEPDGDVPAALVSIKTDSLPVAPRRLHFGSAPFAPEPEPVADSNLQLDAGPESVPAARIITDMPDASDDLVLVDDPEPVAEPAMNVFGRPDAGMTEEALRDVITDLIRQELQGALGERITRNVRKLVRSEINRALAGHSQE